MQLIFFLLMIVLVLFIVVRWWGRREDSTARAARRQPAMSASASRSGASRKNTRFDLKPLKSGELDLVANESGQDVDPLMGADQDIAEQKASDDKNGMSLIVLHLIAENGRSFMGYDLLQSLLSKGLRYGERKIFHRYEQASGDGRVLFSVTTLNKPGTFDLPNISKFSCQGLILFVQLDRVSDSVAAFDLMYKTASQLADDLGGEVLDDSRQPLTDDSLETIRRNIKSLTPSAALTE